MAWSSILSTIGGAAFVEFYWEWLEDVLSHSKDMLTNKALYHVVYTSLFSYDCHPSVLRAFFEHWCSATNTLHTARGEMSISLRDLHKLGGLPIQGKFYDEVVPSVEEFSCRNSRGLPASCRYLFWAYHKLFQEAPGKSGVKISSWIRFWYWDDMKYKRPSKKSGRNKTTRPKGNSDPSGVIGLAGRRTPTELRTFEDFGGDFDDDFNDGFSVHSLCSCGPGAWFMQFRLVRTKSTWCRVAVSARAGDEHLGAIRSFNSCRQGAIVVAF